MVEIKGALDSSILIDALRKFSPALTWLQNQTNFVVASVVWLEILDGVENKSAQGEAIKLLSKFDRVEVTREDFDWAIQQQTRYKLSHNVGGIDCLIAAPCHRLNIPLYTANLKHFSPILSALAQKPY